MQGLENGLITSEYITGHAQMFSGKTMLARIEVKKNIVSEVLDSFGMSTQFEHETEETITYNIFRTIEKGSPKV